MKTNQRFWGIILSFAVLSGSSSLWTAEQTADEYKKAQSENQLKEEIITMLEGEYPVLDAIIKKLNTAKDDTSISDIVIEYLKTLPSVTANMATPQDQAFLRQHFATINDVLDRSGIKLNDDLRKLVETARHVAALHFSDSLNPEYDANMVLSGLLSHQKEASALLGRLKAYEELKPILYTWLMDSFKTEITAAALRARNELNKGKLEIVKMMLDQAKNSGLDSNAKTLVEILFIKKIDAALKTLAQKKQTIPAQPITEKKKWWQKKG